MTINVIIIHLVIVNLSTYMILKLSRRLLPVSNICHKTFWQAFHVLRTNGVNVQMISQGASKVYSFLYFISIIHSHVCNHFSVTHVSRVFVSEFIFEISLRLT